MSVPGTYIFDLDALCEFAALIVGQTTRGMGLELTEEHWPLVADAVSDYINRQLDRVAFVAETTADLNALPVTEVTS